MRVGQCFDPEPTLAENRDVLVVDSDRGSAEVICGILSGLGFQTATAACGVDAVIAARQSTPAIIFVATQLRDATGPELKSWLRANPSLASVPIVAMHSLWEDTQNLQQAAFDALLRKPATAAQVIQAIRSTGLA